MARYLSSFALAVFFLSLAPVQAQDLEVVHKIKQEAFKRSKVMDYAFYMTDVYGPRFSNSPGLDQAAEWVVKTSEEMGLENVEIETWGPYGRGWSTSHFEAHLIEPQYAPLIGVPLAWTPGTGDVVEGVPVFAPLRRDGDMEDQKRDIEEWMDEHRGKLRGKIVLMQDLKVLKEQTKAASKRWSSSELSDRAEHPDLVQPPPAIDPANPQIPKEPDLRDRYFAHAPRWSWEKRRQQRRELSDMVANFLVEEGVALAVYTGWKGDGGTIFPPRPGSHRLEAAVPPPSIALTPEHYNRLVRLLRYGIEPKMSVQTKAQMHEDDVDGINIVAEIPGGDKADEVVIIGAHFDDTVSGTGATDNASGCSIMMEVMRILKTLDLPLDRTVRMVLWSGEEQGLLGSKAYVKKHFGDPETMELKPAHAKVSAYYNYDNGTGKIRGIHLQENDMARPIFSKWFGPFRDLGAGTIAIRNTGGTDHLSFDAVGIPGFQFIQDPVEYSTRTHHSNMDVYDHLVPADLMQSAAIIASLVYETANREEMIPRKPLPEPWPEEARTGE